MEKSRVELYELVWSKPMTHLAKELGLSDVGLRKICVKFGIPLPPRGYWSRLQFGKQDPRPELPFVNNNPQIRLPDEATAATREQLSLMRKLVKQAEQEVEPVPREPQQFKDIRCIRTYQAILERIKELEQRTGESYSDYQSGRRSFPPKRAFDLAFFSSLEDQIVEWHPKLSHFEENLHPNLSHPNRLSCLIFEQGWARSDQRGNFEQITQTCPSRQGLHPAS